MEKEKKNPEGIRPRGENSFEINIELEPINGKRRRQFISFKGSEKDAKRKRSELIAAVGAGSFVSPPKTLVGDYVEARIAHWGTAGKVTERSALRYRELLRNQIAPHRGQRPIQKLTIEEVETWRLKLRAAVSYHTTRAAFMVLRRVLADAVRLKKLAVNVCREAEKMPKKKPGIDTSKMVIVKEPKAFLDQLKSNPRLYVLAALGLYAGMRLGEILALRDRHVDLDAGVIKVEEALDHKSETKAPKTAAGVREITMPAVLVALMRAHRIALMQYRLKVGAGKLEGDHLLFTTHDGRPLRTRTISSDFGDLIGNISRPEITFHSLRHSHASALIHAKVPITMISKRLGHSSPAVTLSIYAHMFADDDRAAADAIEALGG